MLTVKDVMEFLSKSPPDLPVVMSGDAEGNEFRVLSMVQEAAHLAYSDCRDVAVYNAEDAPPGAKPCVVLWPQ